MNLSIAQLGQPVLRRVAAEVPEELFGAPGLRDFLSAMHTTLEESNGAGLAAPQVFMSRRIFLARVLPPPAQDQPAGVEVFINPTIVERSTEEAAAWEGCLSFPELLVLVSRPERVRVSYRNAEGANKVLKLEGLSARIVQHEHDHLDGILTIDRAASTRDIVKQSEIQAVLHDRGELGPEEG
jgi:peptide deformylase